MNPGVAGGDINMWECARFLASRGHEVTFLASAFKGAKNREVLEGIRVVRLGGLHSLWLRTFLFYVTKGRGRYDVVVAEGFGGSRIPRLAPLYVKIPILTEWRQVHRSLFAEQYPRPVAFGLSLMERATAFFHRRTTVLAYTPEGKEAFRRIGFPPENVVVVPVSIRDEWLSSRTAGQILSPNIIWLGKIRRYKCPHHVILAMQQVASVIGEAHLIVAGRHDDKRYENELRQLVERLGMQRHVEFRFDLTEIDKRSVLEGCRVMVLPSPIEGFGIVVLEANACGVPVVASSGVPESVVRDGMNGLRYPFGDIDSLARTVLRILQDDALYGELSDGGLRSVAGFSWERAGITFEETVLSLAHLPKRGSKLGARITPRAVSFPNTKAKE
jgi:glycosyltransferase involved in cell wall biosynthesis